MQDINNLAESHQLGTFIKHLRTRKRNSRAYLILGIFLLVLGLMCLTILVSQLLESKLFQGMSILGTIFSSLFYLLPGIYFIYIALIKKEIFFYEQGLVDVVGKRITVVRYKDITAVWQKIVITNLNVYFVPVGSTSDYYYTIQTHEGVKLKFTDKEVGEYIQNEAYRYQMPQAVATYNAGDDLHFGPLLVGKKGISSRKGTLPWSEIADVKVNNGMVYIDKKGGWFSWISVQAAQIPNLHIFLTLVDQIFGINRR